MYYDIVGWNTRILGAVHVLPAEVASLPWWVMDAFQGAELIEMEHDHRALDACSIDQDTNTLKPWALIFNKLRQALSQTAVQPGVEHLFSDWLKARSRPPMTYIETGKSFADLLDSVPLQDLVKADAAIDEFAPKIATNIAALHAAWERAEHAELEKLQEASPLASVASLRHAFFTARNENWANTIAARGIPEKRQLVTVGCLHLVGADNLLDRLATRGLVTNRLVA